MRGRVRLSSVLSFLVCLALAISLVPPRPAQAVSSGVVISQVYGGGGNSGATLLNDFVELFNLGSNPVSLEGMSIQYASATGTSWQVTTLSGILNPGQYYLVQEAAGTCSAGGCVPLPTPDASGTIPMAAGAGKVALVSATDTLTGSCPISGVVDFVGFGTTANCFEGTGYAPAPSSTRADFRANYGCKDTDNNSVDFAIAAPAPRNSASPLHDCSLPFGIGAADPALVFTGGTTLLTVAVTPGQNPTSPIQSVTADLTSIGGASDQQFFDDQTHGDVASGDNIFSFETAATLETVPGAKSLPATITDAENRTGSTAIALFVRPPQVAIHVIQGASHISPMNAQLVTTSGIVTALRSAGFYLETPTAGWDSDPKTSEGIYVYTSSAPTVKVGDDALVSGTVSEYRAGGTSGIANLTITQLGSPVITISSSANPLPDAVVIGAGGRLPPTTFIESDATDDVETSGIFNPDVDGIDFYESLEGMYVRINDAQAVGPTHDFGSNSEIAVVGEYGANVAPGILTPRGGIILQPGNFNPERIILNDLISGTSRLPAVNVGDKFPGATLGVIDYSFGNFKLEVTSLPVVTSGGLAQEQAPAAAANQLAVAAFNVENLAPTDPPAKFSTLAGMIVNNLRSPDLVSIEEIQDNNGETDNGVVEATTTWNMLITAIQDAGGPVYSYRQIDPVNDADGGATGGNIRQGFLIRTDRGLSFIDHPGADATTANSVVPSADGPVLEFSPGRIDPTNAAFTDSRKPLAGEFLYRGRRIFAIANHFNSKSGDDPLFGRFQPPVFSSEIQRLQQAQVVNDFVDTILAADPDANVIVLGDLNDFQFSNPLKTLEGTPAVLTDLIDTLPANQRYSYVYDGNSETLDHTLFSAGLTSYRPYVYQVVHVNSEFAVQASDHEPQSALIAFNPPAVDPPAVKAEPSLVGKYAVASATGNLIPGDAPYTCTVDYGDGSEEQAGVLTISSGKLLCTGPGHIYTDDGSFTVSVDITNRFDESGTNTSLHAVFAHGIYMPLIFSQP